MIAFTSRVASRAEHLDPSPRILVGEAEYFRLLGYPRGHVPGDRAAELCAQARTWYAANGRPWLYWREVELELAANAVSIEGVSFAGDGLRQRFAAAGITRCVIIAASAGRACEQRARVLWEEGKPDEYFFLEAFGSAVVEQLVSALNADICAMAAAAGLAAIPHYSPGYVGWDVAEQVKLFAALDSGRTAALPEELTVLDSGMLVPRKALLGVIGLRPAPRTGAGGDAPESAAATVPCVGCAFTPCSYRRANYMHDANLSPAPRAAASAAYRTSERALRKWAAERVLIERAADGSVVATFRFDGTTCSNLGQPIAFDYRLQFGASGDGYPVQAAESGPAPGDVGHTRMCAYLSDADGLMAAIAAEHPPIGAKLNQLLVDTGSGQPSGCHCTADGRAHKWRLALEAIHYALHHLS